MVGDQNLTLPVMTLSPQQALDQVFRYFYAPEFVVLVLSLTF